MSEWIAPIGFGGRRFFMTNKEKLALAIESFGSLVAGIGIVLELIFRADILLIVITSGAFLIAFGSLLWVKVFKR